MSQNSVNIGCLDILNQFYNSMAFMRWLQSTFDSDVSDSIEQLAILISLVKLSHFCSNFLHFIRQIFQIFMLSILIHGGYQKLFVIACKGFSRSLF